MEPNPNATPNQGPQSESTDQKINILDIKDYFVKLIKDFIDQ